MIVYSTTIVMRFFKEFTMAMGHYFKVVPFVIRHKIWSFWILPIVFNSLLLGAFAWGVFSFSGELNQTIVDWTGVNSDGFWAAISKVLIWLISFVMIFYTYQFISLIILAPVYSYVSDQVQIALTGIDTPFSMRKLLNDVVRGIVIALKNIGLQLIITIPIFLIGVFIIPLSPITTFLLFIVGAYFQGFAMMDYRNEYHGLNAEASSKYIKEHKGVAIGNGSVFQILLLIIGIGTVFAPVFSIVAAALSIHQIETEK